MAATPKALGSGKHVRLNFLGSGTMHGCQTAPGYGIKHGLPDPRLLSLALLPYPSSLGLAWLVYPRYLGLATHVKYKQTTNKQRIK